MYFVIKRFILGFCFVLKSEKVVPFEDDGEYVTLITESILV